MIGKPKNRIETSKLLLLSVLLFCAILLVTIVVAWVIFDRMDAAALAGVVCTPVGVTIPFYIWKAKNENMRKYGQENTKNFSDTSQY